MPRCNHANAAPLFRKPTSGPRQFDYLMLMLTNKSREGVLSCEDCGALFYRQGTRNRRVQEWRVDGLRADAAHWEGFLAKQATTDGDRRSLLEVVVQVVREWRFHSSAGRPGRQTREK